MGDNERRNMLNQMFTIDEQVQLVLAADDRVAYLERLIEDKDLVNHVNQGVVEALIKNKKSAESVLEKIKFR